MSDPQFDAVARDTNRQWAYATVTLGKPHFMARQFCQFVVNNGLGASDPAENWELWHNQ